MEIEYRIIDSSGDQVRPELFAPYPIIHPMTVIGVMFQNNKMIILLRYQHDTPIPPMRAGE